MRIVPYILVAGLLSGCSPHASAPVAKATPLKAEPSNILHLTWGGIAYPDDGEAKRHWSNWTINLIDGGEAYGWTSQKDITFPHELKFELAGAGKISGVVLDSRFAPVVREDGSMSVSAEGSPVRRFSVMGSVEGPDGPYFKIIDGEAPKDQRTRFDLPAPAHARWIKLVVESNWNGQGQTRLADFGVLGELDKRGDAAPADVSGVYAHEYGPILLRQDGNVVHGCYNDGAGRIEGLIYGRIMRLAWQMPNDKSIGSATLVAANNKLYGFWYRDGDRMGSPWNATLTSSLATAKIGDCAKFLGLPETPAK